MVKRILFIFLPVVIYSCNKLDLMGLIMPTGDGVEKRFEQSVAMSGNLKVDAVKVEENYTFYVAADPHINETHRNLGIFNDALRNDVNASFGVILGDCTDAKINSRDILRRSPTTQSYTRTITGYSISSAITMSFSMDGSTLGNILGLLSIGLKPFLQEVRICISL